MNVKQLMELLRKAPDDYEVKISMEPSQKVFGQEIRSIREVLIDVKDEKLVITSWNVR